MPEASTVSRRAVLGGTAGIVFPALGGCGRAPAAPPALDPELMILVGAITAEHDLIALYEAVRGAHADLAERIAPALAHHREHLAVLRRHYVPGSGRLASPAPAPSPVAQPVPGDRSGALAVLRRAESQAAAARVAEVERAGPGLAQLLASIGACEAGHAAALEGAG
ncbi:hypothetical protein [Actinomadura keratinilytica]|uniref:Ferritin-like domain-containing protein n=1 Tax=Actinomadura keratinilytica TaxID=547461 RepID=A0ABP7ZGL1_9ACTN